MVQRTGIKFRNLGQASAWELVVPYNQVDEAMDYLRKNGAVEIEIEYSIRTCELCGMEYFEEDIDPNIEEICPLCHLEAQQMEV